MIWELKRDCDCVRPCDTEPDVCCWLPFQRPARPPGASFNGLLIAPGAVEWMEQSQEKSPGTGERAHGDFCTDTDWYHSGNIFGHLCSGANPSKELVSET